MNSPTFAKVHASRWNLSKGETIRSLLNRIGVFSLRSALDITRQICSGLREAHAQGVAHRDLKPENLMMDREGQIKIMDFGIARIFSGHSATTLAAIVGTPAYMAPEQVESRTVDQRADIYSLRPDRLRNDHRQGSFQSRHAAGRCL